MDIAAFISGCEGKTLTDAEKDFFRQYNPWGFILFARNIESPEQMRGLCSQLRECVGRGNAPILIDQEGGRVRRLRPPLCPDYPCVGKIGEMYAIDPEKGERMAYLHGRLLAHDLLEVGVNVNCIPVLDLRIDSASDVIGDRAFSDQPEVVAQLGRAMIRGSMEGGVLPIGKHIPGHGRAQCDSHFELPRVTTSAQVLENSDFVPFKRNHTVPSAMTAHIIYEAYDNQCPATCSKVVIGQVIRKTIGFDGLLMSDDISMQALSGDYRERTQSAFAAGCDIVLHCNGDMDQMQAVAQASPVLQGDARDRAERAMNCLNHTGSDLAGHLGAGQETAQIVAQMRLEYDSLVDQTCK